MDDWFFKNIDERVVDLVYVAHLKRSFVAISRCCSTRMEKIERKLCYNMRQISLVNSRRVPSLFLSAFSCAFDLRLANFRENNIASFGSCCTIFFRLFGSYKFPAARAVVFVISTTSCHCCLQITSHSFRIERAAVVSSAAVSVVNHDVIANLQLSLR